MTATRPTRGCNIVMKGGITSGVVYPLAIVELAQEFQFKNIGGTSVGAIAAAGTAAAEYRRLNTGSSLGFDTLRTMPDFLAAETNGQPNLFNLFPPTQATRRLFNVIAPLLGGESSPRTVRGMAAQFAGKPAVVLWRLMALAPLATILALLPTVLLIVLIRDSAQRHWFAWLLLALFLLVSGLLLLIIGHAIRAAIRTLPENGFGFSTGMAPADRTLPGITQWMHAAIQDIAGRTTRDKPLTFGDLWTADKPDIPAEERKALAALCETDERLRAINLQMITTALTHGRPHRLPFERSSRSTEGRFSFREEEFRKYFPGDVVDYLLATGVRHDDGTTSLPPAPDLPILVATRLSLSFPVLIAMVPLHAIDFTMMELTKPAVPDRERVWFIDGGLSSNFPVTLFDAAFPQYPTFGVDLAEFHPAYPQDLQDESRNVWMIKSNGDGTSDNWRRFPSRGLAGIGGYIGAIMETVRNWHDNTQLTVPGLRDRIVHVKLSPSEGGLNLKMDAAKVKALSARGHFAGVMLRERFGDAGAQREGLNWNTHRWVRFQTSMALLERFLQRMDDAFEARDGVYPSYPELVARTEDKNPRTLDWWTHHRPKPYQDLTGKVRDLARNFEESGVSFTGEAPRPLPEMRITPRV